MFCTAGAGLSVQMLEILSERPRKVRTISMRIVYVCLLCDPSRCWACSMLQAILVLCFNVFFSRCVYSKGRSLRMTDSTALLPSLPNGDCNRSVRSTWNGGRTGAHIRNAGPRPTNGPTEPRVYTRAVPAVLQRRHTCDIDSPTNCSARECRGAGEGGGGCCQR